MELARRILFEPATGASTFAIHLVLGDERRAAALSVESGWGPPGHAVDEGFPEAIAGFHASREGLASRHAPDCFVLGGVECWGDGSSVAGRHLLRILIDTGPEGVWAALEELYRAAFEEDRGQAALESMRAIGRKTRF